MTIRTVPPPVEEIEIIRQMVATGEGALSVDHKLRLWRMHESTFPDRRHNVARGILQELHNSHDALRAVQHTQQELREAMERLTTPPLHLAVYLGPVEPREDEAVHVAVGPRQFLVRVWDEVDRSLLAVGRRVLLNSELNLLIEVSADDAMPCGETAQFDRLTDDGRFVVISNERMFVVQPADVLVGQTPAAGDAVRWDPQTFLAFEILPARAGRSYVVADLPDANASQLGGQARHLQKIVVTLAASLIDPTKAEIYQQGVANSILMVGPSGCGKTLMARIAGAEIERRFGVRCSFAVVKPGEWEEPWVGMTERNMRECFKSLAKLADDGPAILFMDEIESIGRLRGHSANPHGDRFLGALLTELDGFVQRGRTAVITATNRKELLDPALLERLSDIEIRVQRPDLRAAREIFGIHLPSTLPFSPNGPLADSTRCRLIEQAVSRLYSASDDAAIALVRFRDGTSRAVRPCELLSGRAIRQICRSATQAAYLRDAGGGAAGLTTADMDEAVADTIARFATTLSPRNVRAFLTDLADDAEVVAVESLHRSARRLHRYTT